MATANAQNLSLEQKIANTIAGHKMAGFDVTDEHRDFLRKLATDEMTVDQLVAEIRSKNADD